MKMYELKSVTFEKLKKKKDDFQLVVLKVILALVRGKDMIVLMYLLSVRSNMKFMNYGLQSICQSF